MKDIRDRKQEVAHAFANADPTVVEVISGCVSLLFGIWFAFPFANPPSSSVLSRVSILAPEIFWVLFFILASLILIFSPRTRPYYNIGVLFSCALWFFFFLVACERGINSLAPAAYLSNTLFCVWIYLRRIGGLGDNLYLTRSLSDSYIYSNPRSGHTFSYASKEEAPKERHS